MTAVVLAAVTVGVGVVGCSGSDDGSAPADSASISTGGGAAEPTDDPELLALPADVRAAMAAVEAELGGPQEYFEVTASSQFTNVFVASDDATAAIPYVYLDGELQAPGPTMTGAAGNTFTADAVTFDDALVLAVIADELPATVIDSLSVDGGPDGTVRYVVAAHSADGGALDIVVAPNGAIVSVEPV